MSIAPKATFEALIAAQFGDSYSEIDRLRDFRAVFLRDDTGRRVLAHLAAMTGWLGSTPVINVDGRDVPHWVSWHEGRRSIMADIVATLEQDPGPAEVIRES